MVAAAIELAGGPTVVAELCGVQRQTVYVWIKQWKVERLVDALKLSRASGVPIEKLAGYAFEASETTRPRSRPIQAKPD
jgi:transposase-like protein